MYHLYEEDFLKIQKSLSLINTCSNSMVIGGTPSANQKELKVCIKKLTTLIEDTIAVRREK